VTTNHPGNRPIRPVFVLILNGAIIVIFSGGQQHVRIVGGVVVPRLLRGLG
jgi:hypothetical protein